ncbi:MAG TPA: glycosyltransferase family 4 protein [Acidimicrobiales bacterium]|nr:glycosyltransferase family 4 protein [Acidimicrobiales bacterium]
MTWISTHVGPAVDDVGGISTVLASYQRLGAHGHRLTVLPSYRSTAPLWGLALWARAVWVLITTPRSTLGVVHAHVSRRGSFVREGSLLVIAHLRGCPTCATVHGSCFGVNFHRFRPLYLFVLRRADRVVTLTSETQDLLRPLLGADRLVTIPNPVDAPDHPSPVCRTGPVALFAGELSRRKGFDVLLEAWENVQRRIPEAELLVVGPVADVPIRPAPGWRHLGIVDRTEVPHLLDRARLGVLPSRHEAMPVFLLEAMAAGRPVVSTDVAAIPTIVGDAGIIVPVGDPIALADALSHLLGDAEEAARVGEIGRRRATDRHGLATVAEAVADLYDQVVRTHDRVPT